MSENFDYILLINIGINVLGNLIITTHKYIIMVKGRIVQNEDSVPLGLAGPVEDRR